MPGIANMIASAALAANCLGFDNTYVKLIADPAYELFFNNLKKIIKLKNLV